MILNNRELMLDGLAFLWAGGKPDRNRRPDVAQRMARAVYLRYFRNCTYIEIAQELQLTQERVRQMIGRGLVEMGKYFNRKYGKSIASDAYQVYNRKA